MTNQFPENSSHSSNDLPNKLQNFEKYLSKVSCCNFNNPCCIATN